MEETKTFGDIVRGLREERKLTLREVARRLHIDISMLGKIEKNNRKPSKAMIGSFAKYFNVSERILTIAFLSDSVAYHIHEEEFAAAALRVAEKKVRYLKSKRHSHQ